MPMPNFMRYVNKRLFNKWELARGNRPVLVHVGRVSGVTYRTPLEPRAVEGGYVFILMYGASSSDWVRNVQAAGRATLVIDGEKHELTDPRIVVGEEGWSRVPNNDKRPPEFLNVTEIMCMDRAASSDAAPTIAVQHRST